MCYIFKNMEKKDIYEHLAKIYLDASSQRKNNKKQNHKILKVSLLVTVAFVFGIGIFLSIQMNKKAVLNSEVALVFAPEVLKINFNFDPAKKETYSLALNKLNLARFKALGFSVKKENYQSNISLRIEFSNIYKEKAFIYLKDIPRRWQDCKINLSEFKGINDWSEMTELSFVVEEWNVTQKKGIVYLDNVRLIK